MPEPTSTKPYLLRAIYEWCLDNGFTPYVSVVVDAQTRVPMEYVSDGEIVLNIGPLATSRMQMGNDSISCSARFGGAARELFIPISAVAAIYAKENGQGMTFETDRQPARAAPADSTETPGSVEPTEPPRPGPGKPTLRRIK
ncbi:MAG: ClpXP protease specificity-enhancing factor [Betaproteobacteria bacterium RIFCSPLOWO2_02_FULL_64_12]|nr:MAG: ClpXP protease specificity-enhancing factor [Betaproteobacteria bacterium RIFCSPLOWO2_02_FULL_64_12]